MRTRNLILILILLGVGLFGAMDHITFHTRGLCVWGSEPTWQDDATVWEASNVGIGGLPSDTLSIEGKIIADAWEAPASVIKAAVAENCYGLDLDIEMFNENMLRDWRRKQLALCENYYDIRIEFDGREFLFSLEEFKEMLIEHKYRPLSEWHIDYENGK